MKDLHLFDLLPYGIITVDSSGMITSVNSALLKFTGFEEDVFINKHFSRIPVLNKNNQNKINTVITAILKGEKHQNFEIRWERAGGELRDTEVIISPQYENSRIVGAIGLFRDITKRKKIENDLVSSKNNYQSLVSIIHDIVFKIDKDDRIIEVNCTENAPLYLSKEQFIGKRHREVMPEYLNDLYSVAVSEVRKNKLPQSYKYSLMIGDEVKWFNATLNQFDNDGSIIAGIKDITELSIAQEKTKNQSLQLQKLLEMGRLLTSTLDIEKVFEHVSIQVRTLLNCNGVTIYILEEDDKTLQPVYAYDPPYEEQILATKVSIDNSFSGQVVKSKKGMIINYAEQQTDGYHIPGTPVDEDHLIVAPFIVNENVIGTLNIYRRDEVFSSADLDLVDTFILFASTAVNNAKKHKELQALIERYKQIEKNLRESENRFKSIVESSPLGIHMYTLKEDGDLIFCGANQSADSILNVDNSQFIGKTIEEAFPPLKDTEVPQKYKAAASKGINWKTQQISYQDDQISGAFEVYAFQTSPDQMVAMFLDITERKKAEEEIRKSEIKYRTLTENLNVGVFRSTNDSQGKFIEVNTTLIKMFGYSSREEIEQVYVSDLYKDKEGREKFLTKLKNSDTVVHDELELQKKDGSVFIGSVSTIAIRDKNYNILFYDGIIDDITERKLEQQAVEEALESANQANRVKDLFMANMSHEIRTPLNSLLGFSNIIHDRFAEKMDAEEKEYFKIINSSGQRLLRSVHEVLDISQITAGVMPYNPATVQLSDLVKSVYDQFIPVAQDKQLDYNFENNIENSVVKVDEHSIIKAISNLIDNAIKYTDQGSVTVSLEMQDGKNILLIKDTGIGINQDYIEKIYDSFSQESMGYTKKYQGLGLGLSIAKKCLDINEVPITIESESGVGTTFKLTFTPVDKEAESRASVIPGNHLLKTNQNYNQEQPVILLVEDDVNNRKIMEVILNRQYITSHAESVSGAKIQLQENNVGLILLDLSLAGDEDGLELMEHIKSIDEYKHIPVIAVTAHAFPRDKENALKAGCVDYMSKPINIKALLKKIEIYYNTI